MKTNAILTTATVILTTALMSVGNMFGQTATPPTYAVIDLGPSIANGINNNGQVVGGVGFVDGFSDTLPHHAFLYSGGNLTDLGVLHEPGFTMSVATAINDNGQVVGWSFSAFQHAFLYSKGIMINLTPPEYELSSANGINNKDQVVGSFNISDNLGGGSLYHAFLYSSGNMIDLGTLPGYTESYGQGINDNGQVVGTAYTSSGVSHAFLYSDGSMTDLGVLSGDTDSGALAINNKSQIVGISSSGNDATGPFHSRPFLYNGAGMTALGTLPNFSNGLASSINNDGLVVGYSYTTTTATSHAFLSDGKQVWDLNSLILINSGWTLEHANAINNNNQIVGYGLNPSGNKHAFLLNPLGATEFVPPHIAAQPQNQTITTGRDAFFTAAAQGTAPLAYQWRKNGVNIPNATDSSLTLKSVIAGDSGAYSMLVRNDYGSAISDAAYLAVLADGSNGTSPTKTPVPPPPEQLPAKTGLVIVTHGCLPGPVVQTPPQWLYDMRDAIASHVSTDWQVVAYAWPGLAWAYFDPNTLLGSIPYVGRVPYLEMLEEQVMPNAKNLGFALGTQLAQQHWVHVHFIGHSAGSALIQEATDTLRRLSRTVEIHTTFLDPYVDLNYSGRTWYGSNSDWSDCYYAVDPDTGDRTDGPLLHAYNVDVTWVDRSADITTKYCYETGSSDSTPIANVPCGKNATSTHEWPHEFYDSSIGGTLKDCGRDYGFSFSKEGRGWNDHGARVPNDPAVMLCNQGSILFNRFPIELDPIINVGALPSASSSTGVNLLGPSSFTLTSDDPAWLAVSVTVTNPVNLLQFRAGFTDTNSADGLLTVYWNTNKIGAIEERSVSANPLTYTFSLPGQLTNGIYSLSMRLDEFSQTWSSILIGDVQTGHIGVPITPSVSLTVTTNKHARLTIAGSPGYDYLLQRSWNLANWIGVAAVSLSGSTALFEDADATNRVSSFYRIVIP
jgi:probable HAF family extracellular repeat protein